MERQMVNVRQYDPNWKVQYKKEKKVLLNLISNQIHGIQHIGSTSIPDLIASPTVDIMIGVKDLFEIGPLLKPLKSIDYEFIPKPQFRERRFFRKGEWGEGTYHLHICEYKSDEWMKLIVFRDYLRQNPETAQEYAQLKFTLSKRYKYNPNAYSTRKGIFVNKIVEMARLEIQQGSIQL
jgi:GrpB-like predicted nucleotidyltransferase (UPF0157 family)